MKKFSGVVLFIFCFDVTGFSQSTGTKINNTTLQAKNSAANAAEAARGAKNAASDVKETFRTFFPKKDKTAKPQKETDNVQETQAAAQKTASSVPITTDAKTLITVTNIDFAKLKSLQDNIKACAIVKATAMKYNTTSSTIEVTHSGTTDELLNLMLQTCKDIFDEKKLEGFEDGKINIKL